MRKLIRSFLGVYRERAIQRKMVGAGITILIGFGLAFSVLFLMNQRNEQLSDVGTKTLESLVALNQLNYELKSVLSKQESVQVIYTELLPVISESDRIIRNTANQRAVLDEVLMKTLRNSGNVWNDLESDLRHSLTHLEEAADITGQEEIAVYGINFFLDSYEPSGQGVLGNADLFAKLRDFKAEITVIENNTNLFLRNLTNLVESIDGEHDRYSNISKIISLVILIIVTIFTIAFVILFSTELTQTFRNLIKELASRNEILKEGDEKIRAILAAVPDVMMVLDREGYYIDIFTGSAHMLGGAADELFGTTIYDILSVEDGKAIRGLIGKVLGSRDILNYGYSLPINDVEKWFSIRMVSLKYQGEDCVLCLVHDITEQKRATDQLDLSLKEKEILLQEIHHRVKNNMQIIISMLQLQKDHYEKTGAVDLEDTINRVRIFADIHRKLYLQEEIAKINFAQQIQDILEELVSAYSVRRGDIVLDLDLPDSLFELDKAISCGLLLNELITNSLKHAFADTGMIKISIKNSPSGEIEEIIYEDDGKGRGDPESGFGTKIISALAEQMGLSFYVNSKSGTQYRFTRNEAGHAAEISENGILYVEDELIIARSRISDLEKLGYSILKKVITTGEEAVSFIQESQCKPAMILMDIKLRGEMTGLEAAAEIRKHCPSIPVIFMSGYEDSKHLEAIHSIPNSCFLKKTCLSSEIKQAIDSLIADLKI